VSLTSEDMARLERKQYLNDSIIDVYVQYIRLATLKREMADQCHFFSSFFYQKLVSLKDRKNFAEARRWTQSVDLLKKRYLFIPVCKEMHWFLVVVRNPGEMKVRNLDRIQTPASALSTEDPCICVFDSLRSKHKETTNIVREFLLAEWRHVHDDVDAFTHERPTAVLPYIRLPISQQKNEYDCGLYLLKCIEWFFLYPMATFLDPVRCKALFNTLSISEYRVEIRENIRALIASQTDLARRMKQPLSPLRPQVPKSSRSRTESETFRDPQQPHEHLESQQPPSLENAQDPQDS